MAFNTQGAAALPAGSTATEKKRRTDYLNRNAWFLPACAAKGKHDTAVATL